MSAFLVSKETIDAIVTFAAERKLGVFYGNHCPAPEELTSFGQMLWSENHRSLVARYGDDNAVPLYHYARHQGALATVQFVKLLHCLAYQSCESDDWSTTAAAKAIVLLESHAWRLVAGYEDAEWGL